jgi:hypothetical protein
MGEQVPWPGPPREIGPWNGGPPIAPPGNTPLPPLPGASGTMGGASAAANPWAQPVPEINIPPERRGPAVPPPPGVPGSTSPLGPTVDDRAPMWVLAASVIVIIALVAGGVYLVLKGGRQYPDEWDARVDPIATWVSKERKLAFAHPVQVNFQSSEEYKARATQGGEAGDPETDQYYADQVAQLRALGFITGDVDLGEATDTLSDSGTLAYYDPDVEQVFVRGTKMTPALEVTLAHELTHVLQDQNFDLNRLGDFDDGRAAVLRALAEGDAGRIEDAYVEDQLTAEERKAYEEESASSGDEALAEVEEKVPPILTTLFASPYILGPELIATLDALGPKKIDEALQDPPSEEALFDPRTYDTGALKPREVTVEAPKGAEVLEEGEFGPTTWYLMLAARMDAKVALEATDGWGGDRYVVYRKDDRVCVDLAAQGDTVEDTTELAEALVSWVATSPKDTASAANEDGTVTLTSCDPGKDATNDGAEVSPELLGIPVSRTQVYVSGLEQDATPAQSSCFAQGVIERFSTEQLTDPDGAFFNSAEGQKILADLRTACG